MKFKSITSLGQAKSHECRIEDLDDRGLLISDAERHLSYFVRTDVPTRQATQENIAT